MDTNYGRVLGGMLLMLSMSLHAGDASEAQFSRAQGFVAKSEWKAAVIELKSLLQENPNHPEARLLLGETYLRQGDVESALKELDKVRELGLPEDRWIVALNRAKLLKGDTRAITNELRIADSLPTAVRAQLLALQGTALLSERKVNEARERFDQALQADPNSADARLGLATLGLAEKAYGEAARQAESVLQGDSNNLNAWILLGEVRRLNNQANEAIAAFGKALAIHTNEPRALQARAATFLGQGKIAEAKKDIASAQAVTGDSPYVLYLSGVAAYQEQRWADLDEALGKLLNQQPEHGASLLLLGTSAYAQGKLEQADNHLSRYLRMAPADAAGAKLLGAVRLKMGRGEEALQVLRSAEQQSQSDAQFLALLGSAYLQTKQFDKGTEYLQRAVEIAPDVAGIRTQLALGRIASGRVDEAIGDLKSAVQIDKNLFQADILLATSLIQQKKYDEAMAAAQAMAAKAPDNPMPDNLIGLAQLAKGDKAAARAAFERSLKIKPEYATAKLNLARMEQADNRLDAATKLYEEVVAGAPDNVSAYLALAQIAEQQKDARKALAWLEQAREKNPKALAPALLLTRYHLTRGEPLVALEVARAAVASNADNAAALNNLGLVEVAANQVSAGVATLRSAVAKEPENAEFKLNLARALVQQDAASEAVREVESVLEKSPDLAPARLLRAELHLRAKEFDAARKIAQNWVAKDPKQGGGYQLEGDVDFAQGHWKTAAERYAKAFAIAPNQGLVQRMAQAQRSAGDARGAVETLNRWLANAPDDAQSWLALGMAQQDLGDKVAAAQAYEKALNFRPDNLLIANNLAWLYQENQDPRAVQLAEKLLAGAENNPEMLDTVGWIFLNNGRVERGLVLLQQAAVLAPHIPPIRLHMAEALAKVGRTDEARKELERLLREHKAFPERSQAEALLKGL